MRYFFSLMILAALPSMTLADSDKPVCKGFSIDEKYRGVWKTADAKPAIDLTTGMAFMEDEEDGAEETKAWTCSVKGQDYIVFKFGEAKNFPDGNFESRAISREGFRLKIGGEAFVTEGGIKISESQVDILSR